MTTVAVLYAPVLHDGYLQFLQRHSDVKRLYIIDDDLVEELKSSGYREIREVKPAIMRQVLLATGLTPKPENVHLLTARGLRELAAEPQLRVIMPKLSICQRLSERLPHAELVWDTVFLQWDEKQVASQQPAAADHTVSAQQFDRRMMGLARESALKSADWWRRVGAVLVRDGEVVLTAHNRHVPSEQTAYIQGDPRDFVPAGTDSHIATTLHAEQAIITEAARHGIPLESGELYTPVFPCPMCAKQIAYSGIKKVYFESGHASIDGESILRNQGVELILVK